MTIYILQRITTKQKANNQNNYRDIKDTNLYLESVIKSNHITRKSANKSTNTIYDNSYLSICLSIILESNIYEA